MALIKTLLLASLEHKLVKYPQSVFAQSLIFRKFSKNKPESEFSPITRAKSIYFDFNTVK